MEQNLLATRLRRVRMAAGLSQTALAAEMGFKTSVPISKVEAGKRSVSASDLDKWCRACRVSADAVLNGDPLTVDISEAAS